MKRLLYIFLLLISSCRPCFATTDGQNVLSGVDTQDATVLINDQFRQNIGRINAAELSIDTLNGLFSNNVLQVRYGGTGQDLSSVAQNTIPYFSSIGTFGNIGIGTSGYVLTSTGLSTPPSWSNQKFTLVSTTTVTATGSSASIPITSGKFYLVKIDVSTNSVAQGLNIQFNGDSGSHYRYAYRGLTDAAGADSGNSTGATSIALGGSYDVTATDYRANYEFKISPQGTSSGKYIHIQGNAWGNYSAGSCKFNDFFGTWSNGATATSFTINGSNWTGIIYLYELSQS